MLHYAVNATNTYMLFPLKNCIHFVASEVREGMSTFISFDWVYDYGILGEVISKVTDDWHQLHSDRIHENVMTSMG